MHDLVQKILSQSEIVSNPPVLIDIGASGQIHHKWKKIAKHSVCLAFDADERDFQFIEKEQSNFNKLYVYNCIASDKEQTKTDFFLTRSPYCSSVLKPDTFKLKPYINSQLFEINKKIELNAIHIQKALDNAKLDCVDWFKTDSQGIDLRLFKALDERVRKKIILAEFEPGIIDAYEGEDKLHSVIEELTRSGFWLSDIQIKGSPRLSKELLDSEFKGSIYKKLIKESIKKTPGWGEMTFISSFENLELDKRSYLLGWLFSSLEGQHSFALELADKGYKKYNYQLFNELKQYSKGRIKREVYSLKFLPTVFQLIRKKIF